MMENRQTSCSNNYRTNQTCHSQHSNPSGRQILNIPSRRELMQQINQYSFAVNEATLFLDTHPQDTEAMNYFQKYRQLRLEAVQNYAKYYAPLLIDYAVSDKVPWSWVNEPWPWEGVER